MNNKVTAVVCALIIAAGIILAPVAYQEYEVRLCVEAVIEQYKGDRPSARVYCVYRLLLE